MKENDKIFLERANFIDAFKLSQICKKSFDKEMILHKNGKSGGPPFYDDPNWHVYSMKEGIYHKILLNKKIVGGIIAVIRKKIEDKYHLELLQIYVEPEHWNKGIGQIAVKQIESWFPDMYKFSTGTPSFSITNIHFYEKLGFKKTGESYCEDDQITLILFEKLYLHS